MNLSGGWRYKPARKQFIAKGGRIVTKRSKLQSIAERRQTIETITRNGFQLPTLPQLRTLPAESEELEQLPDEEIRKLDDIAKEIYCNVSWNFSAERKNYAKWTAAKLLERIEETLDNVYASSHVEYINRERAFAQRGGCIFHAHGLPSWAHDDPKNFFQAADKYEGVGNRRYREIEFALPNELTTVAQYRQIIDAFIAKHLSDHYYAYSIHNKIGVMSDGQHHPHVHIMFSERFIDDVEKQHERTPENFFKYPLRKNVQVSFEERWKRGAPKNRHWAEKSFLAILRADFAQIHNEVLEQNGLSIWVDHRSLKAQKATAEQNGNTFLARLFSRIPEEYVGIISCHENNEPKCEFRALRKQQFDLVMQLDVLTTKTEELETKDAVHPSSVKAKNLMDSPEYAAHLTKCR